MYPHGSGVRKAERFWWEDIVTTQFLNFFIFQPVNLNSPSAVIFIFYIKMANGSEVLLGLLLILKTFKNKRKKENTIVLNVFLRRTLHNV